MKITRLPTLAFAAFMLSSSAILAQNVGGYTVMTPGQPPTVVSPSAFGDGYRVMTPGQPLTTVSPNASGGYTAMTPGQPLTIISPSSYGDPGNSNHGSYSGPAAGAR